MKHTPEPWAICPLLSHPFSPCYDSNTGELRHHHGTIAIRAGKRVVATCAAMSGNASFPQTNEELEANASRIVECVNACAGIENPSDIPSIIETIYSATQVPHGQLSAAEFAEAIIKQFNLSLP